MRLIQLADVEIQEMEDELIKMEFDMEAKDPLNPKLLTVGNFKDTKHSDRVNEIEKKVLKRGKLPKQSPSIERPLTRNIGQLIRDDLMLHSLNKVTPRNYGTAYNYTWWNRELPAATREFMNFPDDFVSPSQTKSGAIEDWLKDYISREPNNRTKVRGPHHVLWNC